uniref:Uncharacterized protein n=1 Tax=Knipowitschia caucasica TaxID=637954 RepID=A0AAV2IQD9_KNICA
MSWRMDSVSPESTVTSLLSSSGRLTELRESFTYKDMEYDSASAALDAYITDFERRRHGDSQKRAGPWLSNSSHRRSTLSALRNRDVLRERLSEEELHFLSLPVSSLCHRDNRDRVSMTTDELLNLPNDGSMPITHTTAVIHGILAKPGPSHICSQSPAHRASQPIRALHCSRCGALRSQKRTSLLKGAGPSSTPRCDWPASRNQANMHLPHWLSSNKSALELSDEISLPEFSYPPWIHCTSQSECGYRGQGQSESGYRGQGQSESSYRGQGQSESSYRGQGQSESGYRGQGQSESSYRGQGQSESGYRGQGQSESGYRGQGQSESGYRGQGQSESGYRGQDQSESDYRGQGQSESSYRGGTEEHTEETLRSLRLQFAEHISHMVTDRSSSAEWGLRDSAVESLILKADRLLDSLQSSASATPVPPQAPGPESPRPDLPDPSLTRPDLPDPEPPRPDNPGSPDRFQDLREDQDLSEPQAQPGPLEAFKQMLFRLERVETQLQRQGAPESSSQTAYRLQENPETEDQEASLNRALHHLRRLKCLVQSSET